MHFILFIHTHTNIFMLHPIQFKKIYMFLNYSIQDNYKENKQGQLSWSWSWQQYCMKLMLFFSVVHLNTQTLSRHPFQEKNSKQFSISYFIKLLGGILSSLSLHHQSVCACSICAVRLVNTSVWHLKAAPHMLWNSTYATVAQKILVR